MVGRLTRSQSCPRRALPWQQIDDPDRYPLSPPQAAQERTFPNCRFLPIRDMDAPMGGATFFGLSVDQRIIPSRMKFDVPVAITRVTDIPAASNSSRNSASERQRPPGTTIISTSVRRL